ncbi:MAG: DUF2235 domain-containing protein [Acidobacteriota bacterium]|nr:DUF2235 domain-containing protein [Acidobacteriota bacterium]
MSEILKNIVLCSDGTGQAGTKARGSNVWRLGMAVDRHDHERDGELRRQIVFYDQGVGTSALSVKKTLGSAFGYGLAESMCHLYIHLARTASPS